ncbi:MAG TPA: hypothetical protein VL992_03855 [Tepidisphaeraceae bacterium]|nr:hypothetical protein [Tepidisphaeraceae bacterium]
MATDRTLISRLVGGILAAAVLAGIVNVLYATLSDAATENHNRLIGMYGQFDAAFSHVAGRADRVVLQFQNFDDSSPSDRVLILILFYRAVYAMYPAHVGLGNPAAALFSDVQIIAAAQEPIDKWVASEHIDAVMRIARDGKNVRIVPLFTHPPSKAP